MLTQLNTTYISPALSDKLSRCDAYAVTTVVAPVGYGKTHAISWWLDQQKRQTPGALFFRQVLVTDSLDSFWRGFCRNLRQWPELQKEMEALGFPTDASTRELMLELLSDFTDAQSDGIFYIIDDLHLLPDPALTELLAFLCDHLPTGARIILLSRNVIFNERVRMKLGPRLLELSAEDLHLDRDGIRAYADKSNVRISARDAEKLARTTEGWFSMVYLQLRAYVQNGKWPENTDSIYPLIDEVLLQPLNDRQRSFLICMGIPDDFSREEAAFLWPDGDSGELLRHLVEQNAFVTCADGVYRYHNMLRSCVLEKFSRLPDDQRRKMLLRMGQWYEQTQDYFNAEVCYSYCKAWDDLLRAFFSGQGLSITSREQDRLLDWYRNCPKESWYRNPGAILAMLRKLFSFGRIAEMQHMKQLLIETMQVRDDLTQEEKDNYLGEMELNMSFLAFNDISAMSAFHRRACQLITRPVVSMRRGSWTFGSPSVLLLYHRTVGGLDRENEEMRECMPWFYQVTNDHGFGAEYVMQAETDFYRGNLVDAELHYRLAVEKIREKKKYSLWLAADCLKVQMEVLQGHFEQAEEILRKQEKLIRKGHRYVLLHTVDLWRTCLFSLMGQCENAPAWIQDEAVPSPLLRPAEAAVELARSQWLLARGEWATAAAREERVLNCCRRYQGMLFGTILAEIQLAEAYEQLGMEETAVEHLRTALDQALPDGLVMPFAFASVRLTESLKILHRERGSQMKRLLELSEQYREARENMLRERFADSSLQSFGLTDRELEIARMTARRMSRREIGEKLCISEKTVSNRLTTIYEKMGLEGQTRNKREALIELLGESDR